LNLEFVNSPTSKTIPEIARYLTMDKFLKPSNSEYYVSSSEHMYVGFCFFYFEKGDLLFDHPAFMLTRR
jgi:hypothetical protein